MLLKNFVVEHKLMNGSIGHVKAICYKYPASPKHNADNDVQYVIVDFPQCTIPTGEALIPGMLPTCVPIPVVTERCKKKCCSICELPLHCCVVLSVHKSQGVTVKKDNSFEKLIVNLPTEQARSTPGLDLWCHQDLTPYTTWPSSEEPICDLAG
jgi:hypothetical protein